MKVRDQVSNVNKFDAPGEVHLVMKNEGYTQENRMRYNLLPK